ncbi:MAG: IS21 family transposase [Desulfuromonadales bacterium]|nr:IS21 family transposase [Desulfuromonadales bacterium]
MQTPDDVAVMLRLRGLGWGAKSIARELGISKNTVKSYIRQGGWAVYRTPPRAKALDGLEAWLEKTFHQHGGNADVVRQELARVHGIVVSLRTVERGVKPFREQLAAAAKATVRFETPPGRQLQIDFGSTRVPIGNEVVRVFLFVATLGYSRRPFVAAFAHERQSAWLAGIEGAFHHFGGVPEHVLLDNPKPLVTHHDLQTREVIFNERFLAFTRYWGFTPRACAPYRARTKGKDESGVKYVKRNAIAGRRFASWEDLQAHLAQWTREIADTRVHGTTGERPIDRFERDEIRALRPINGRPPFQQIRELRRRVGSDACVEVDTNAYSVPWRLIGRHVTVQVTDDELIVLDVGQEVARHPVCAARRQRVIDRSHLIGIVGAWSPPPTAAVPPPDHPVPHQQRPLLRPLAEYEAVAGGAW